MNWIDNPIIELSIDGGSTWIKLSDHGRTPLTTDVERIETAQRMVNGTMRKYVVSKKRTFGTSWQNFPDKDVSFIANGDNAGAWLEEFYNTHDEPIQMRLRSGSDNGAITLTRDGTVNDQDNERIFLVMFTDFSKEVVKRGIAFDLWNISLSMEEV